MSDDEFGERCVMAVMNLLFIILLYFIFSEAFR